MGIAVLSASIQSIHGGGLIKLAVPGMDESQETQLGNILEDMDMTRCTDPTYVRQSWDRMYYI